MVSSPIIMVARNLGILIVVNDISFFFFFFFANTSKMEKFLRKKYMGVWQWASSRVGMIMVRFPVMLSM